MKEFILSTFLLVLLQGCSGWHSFISDLNTRSVESCIYFTGSAGPYISIKGVTATGGVLLESCIKGLGFPQ